jgi:hypothetical protein
VRRQPLERKEKVVSREDLLEIEIDDSAKCWAIERPKLGRHISANSWAKTMLFALASKGNMQEIACKALLKLNKDGGDLGPPSLLFHSEG